MNKPLFLAAMVLIAISSACLADGNPLHNFNNPLDVDGNNLVQPRDALLIINELQWMHLEGVGSASPLVSTQPYYWDTTNDNLVTPRDALLVINNLLLPTNPVPEPGSFVLASLALISLAVCGWRMKRSRAH